ncbi:amidohydrolase family protein [Haladaptatus sp. T7]|uniref:amidohydrolase family protein n=1 Tax=Haladaptatus sp. T7 TaxID=2029368 RepID=UPI0021A255A5|nr:amidohydrolase family protein [Haladaptatus sp. T7]GKZ15187.1 amidohydrolase [Haladaptatus sp. T7]
MVIDSHTHAWGLPSQDHPWVNGDIIELVDTFSTDAGYTADKLLADMDEAGVDEAVVVGYPICEWTDNWYTIRATAEYDRLSGIVMIDQFADDAVANLRSAMANDGVLGFRLGAICPYDRMWETFDPTVDWLRDVIDETEFWQAARETDATVQILAHVDQLDQVLELVDAYPELTYLLDHFSHADPSEKPGDSAFAAYADFSEYDNVYAKVSEVQHRSAEEYPYSDMHDHVRWLLDKFGRERVIWGADFPNVSDVATYDECVTWLEHVDELSTGDINWLRGRSFERALS